MSFKKLISHNNNGYIQITAKKMTVTSNQKTIFDHLLSYCQNTNHL